MARFRKRPNILITGTPGTGKTTLATALVDEFSSTSGGTSASAPTSTSATTENPNTNGTSTASRPINLRHIDINRLARERPEIRAGHDSRLGCAVIDEERLLDVLEAEGIEEGGCVIDWHACDLFPERWIDAVVVLRVSTATLYDRLRARNYTEVKLQENLDVEIMEVLLQEARESYAEEIIWELHSDSLEEMDENLAKLVAWVKLWVNELHDPSRENYD